MSEQPHIPKPGQEIANKAENEAPAFESSIKRHQLRYFEIMGGKTVEFSLENTKIFTHPQEYEEFDHVYRKKSAPEENNVYFFKQDYERLFNTIKELGFVAVSQPWPSEEDEKLYYQFQSNKLQNELNKFSNGGDL